MIIGIPWLFAPRFFSVSVIRARGSQRLLKVFVWHLLLRELVCPYRWVNSILGLRHTWVNLRNHASFLIRIKEDAPGCRNPFDIAVRYTDYLIALFSRGLLLLSSDGISKSVHIAGLPAGTFFACDGGVRGKPWATIIKITPLFNNSVDRGSLLLQSLGAFELQFLIIVLPSLDSRDISDGADARLDRLNRVGRYSPRSITHLELLQWSPNATMAIRGLVFQREVVLRHR
jgi:hypothetical protein